MAYWDVVTGRQTWSDYITAQDQSKAFQNALQVQTKSLTTSSAKFALSQRDYQIALQSGLGALEERMSKDTDNLTNTLELGFERLGDGIDRLNADFNLMMGDIIWKLEVTNERLASILKTLQAPLDTQAKELRQRAEDAYRNGWYDEALEDFLESERKNYQDFAVHRSIGNIHLYHVVDLPKALQYYMKAAKYAGPRDSRQAAEAEYFAGVVCGLQQNIKDALAHMYEATELNPNLYEGFFMHAQFAAMLNDPTTAVRSLQKAIRGDSRYHERAKTAIAFDDVRPQVSSLLENLMREVREKAKRASKTIEGLHRRCDDLLTEDKLNMSHVFDSAESRLSLARTYTDFYQFLVTPKQIESELLCAEQRRDEKIRQAQQKIEALRQEISSERQEIANRWKNVGFALAILAGVFVAAQVCSYFANQRHGPYPGFLEILEGLFGALGTLVFGLAFWLGVVVVPLMALWQMVSTIAPSARISKLKTEIASREATMPKRRRPKGP